MSPLNGQSSAFNDFSVVFEWYCIIDTRVANSERFDIENIEYRIVDYYWYWYATSPPFDDQHIAANK